MIFLGHLGGPKKIFSQTQVSWKNKSARMKLEVTLWAVKQQDLDLLALWSLMLCRLNNKDKGVCKIHKTKYNGSP